MNIWCPTHGTILVQMYTHLSHVFKCICSWYFPLIFRKSLLISPGNIQSFLTDRITRIHEPPDREDQSVPLPVRVVGTYRSSRQGLLLLNRAKFLDDFWELWKIDLFRIDFHMVWNSGSAMHPGIVWVALPGLCGEALQVYCLRVMWKLMRKQFLMTVIIPYFPIMSLNDS